LMSSPIPDDRVFTVRYLITCLCLGSVGAAGAGEAARRARRLVKTRREWAHHRAGATEQSS
jgi:hypothetical protein